MRSSLIKRYCYAVLLLFPNLVFGAAGNTSANFLKIGMGARAAAMADSFTAVADDPTAVYWNPAGLALVKGTSLSTTHGEWLQGVTNDYIALSQPIGNGTVGLGFINEGTQSFNSTLESSFGTYAGQGNLVSASDWALSAAYGDSLGSFIPGDFFKDTLAGVKVNLVGQNAVNLGGNTVSFDVGFLHLLPQQNLAFGLDVQNVGPALDDHSLPVLFKAGVSWYRPANFNSGDRLTLAADLDLHDDTGLHPTFGMEYRSPFGSDLSGALRAGARSTDDQYGFSFLTFGGGIEKKFDGFDLGLDYAFAPYGTIGPTHRFTLNLRLGSPQVKVPLNSLDSGMSYMSQGQYDKALKVFQEAAQKDPNNPRVNSLMGTCLFKMGRFEDAQKIGQPSPSAPSVVPAAGSDRKDPTP